MAAETTTTTTTLVSLQSDDGKVFAVPRAVAEMSVTVKNQLEDLGESEEAIPLPGVSACILQKVLEFCQHHHEHPEDDRAGEKTDGRATGEFSQWDTDFCDVDQVTLFGLILAANYLDVKPLLDAACKTVADMIKGKTPDEIRKAFNIKNDFTPEEEEQIRRENEWCEDR